MTFSFATRISGDAIWKPNIICVDTRKDKIYILKKYAICVVIDSDNFLDYNWSCIIENIFCNDLK